MKIPTISLGKVQLFIVITFVVVGAVVAFYPIEPIKINHVKIQGTEFKAGGEMKYIVDRCKSVSSATPGTSSRYFVPEPKNGKADIFISSNDSLGAQGCLTVPVNIDIPAHVKTGCYRLKLVTRYYPNALREPITTDYLVEKPFCVTGIELSAQLEIIRQQLEDVKRNLATVSEENNLGYIIPQETTSPQTGSSDSLSSAVPKPAEESLPVTQEPIVQPSTPAPQSVQPPTPARRILDLEGLVKDITGILRR